MPAELLQRQKSPPSWRKFRSSGHEHTHGFACKQNQEDFSVSVSSVPRSSTSSAHVLPHLSSR